MLKIQNQLVILILFIFCSQKIYTQTPIYLESLLQLYKETQEKKIDSICQLTKQKSGLLWLNLLPSTSYNYNPLLDRNFLSFGVSLSNIGTYAMQKNNNRIEVEKLKISLKTALDNKLIQFSTEINQVVADSLEIETQTKIYDLLKKSHEILREQYAKNQINLIDWLNDQKILAQQEKSLQKLKLLLWIRKERLLKSIKNEPFGSFSNPSFPQK